MSIYAFRDTTGSESSRLEITAKTSRQAVAYIAVYFYSQIGTILMFFGVFLGDNKELIYWYFSFVATMWFVSFPLQGFIQSVIFIRQHFHPLVRDEQAPLHFLLPFLACCTFGLESSVARQSSSRNTRQSLVASDPPAGRVESTAEPIPQG